MKLNRRQFIKRIIIGIASIEAILLIKDGISKKSVLNANSQLFSAGKLATFRPGHVYPFLQQKFYLKRFSDGGFMAISLKCTHLGCMVNYDSQTEGFSCPCHSSQFNAYGEVLSAPAPRPLDTFPVTAKDGELYVDLGSLQRRTSYNKSQLTYV